MSLSKWAVAKMRGSFSNSEDMILNWKEVESTDECGMSLCLKNVLFLFRRDGKMKRKLDGRIKTLSAELKVLLQWVAMRQKQC